MYYILIALIVAAACSGILLRYSAEGYGLHHNFAAVVGVVLVLATAIAALVTTFTIYQWLGAEHKAAIINRAYQTNYTQEEIFWAGDVIEEIRELQRQRIEVNGDLMREQADSAK